MDHSKGNADGSPPQVSSDEIFSEDHNDTLERNPEDVLQKRFDTAYDQSGTQFQINEHLSKK